MITFKDVSKTYEHQGKQVLALDNVTFQIETSELFGVIGESGSGKSTLLRMINTLEQPDHGEIKINNHEIFQSNEAEQRKNRKKVGMIFQHFNLLYNQTVAENVSLPLKLNKSYEAQQVLELLDFVNLSKKADYYPKQLSGGEKQRVGIARALVTQPEILLCDEPTSALDGQNADDIMELLQRVNRRFGTTIVVVSHELSLIKQLCNRAAILEHGRVLEVIKLEKSKPTNQFDSYYDRVREMLQ